MTDKAGLTEGHTEVHTGKQTDDLWHARDGGAVCAALNTSSEGLSATEARARLEACGPNRLPASRKRTAFERLWAHINSPLIWIMLVAAVVAGFLGHTVDAVVICLVIIVNTIIGYVQEGKAEKALDAIAEMMAPHAQVWRDGQRLSVSAEDIVPGDVVWLEAGDRVPADLRLIQAKSLKVEEAALTGESVPVEKHSDVMAKETPLAERAGMVFSGTFVTTGQGVGVVVGTGAQTELGRINAILSRVE
ncbi:MAG: HAD-IC family P-type ATPase, partial [Asticcacaulis sp.]